MIRENARDRAGRWFAAPCASAVAAILIATCSGSQTPVVLATGEVSANSAAVIGNNLYWLQTATQGQMGALRTIPISGGTASTVAAVTTPRNLLLTSTTAIIGSNGGDVYGVDLASGAVTVILPKDETTQVLALAVNGDKVYAALATGALVSGSLSQPGTATQIDSVESTVSFLAAAGTFLYWGTTDLTINREPADGSGSAQLLGMIDGDPPAAPVLLGSNIYFFGPTYISAVNTSTGTLSTILQDGTVTMPTDGGGMSRGALSAWGLAGNGSTLFLGQKYGVGRVNLNTGGTSLVVSEATAGSGLAADDKNVYWISGSIDIYGDPVAGFTVYRAHL